MARLRGPNGCPWDREQTLASLRGFLLEETYEVLQAIDSGDRAALAGEIGDLIFEGVFLAQVSSDAGSFTIVDSLSAITAKLIRRHPHIFDPNGRPLVSAGEVVEQWEQIKAKEQTDAGNTSIAARRRPRDPALSAAGPRDRQPGRRGRLRLAAQRRCRRQDGRGGR